MDVIPSLAASPVAFQKSAVFCGLLELDERVYIGMTVTFDQITLNGEVISWNSQTYALQVCTQTTSCP